MRNYTYVKNPVHTVSLSSLGKDVVRTLLYFSIFKYPMTCEELYYNCSDKNASIQEVKEELDKLYEQGMINKKDSYFFVGTDDTIIEDRIARNKKGVRYLVIAKRMGRFISYFPYVRGVFISGSLSKGCVDEKGDIDFFIITAPGRLWLSRTLIILFKKIFLLNSRKYLCPNYFIDTNHLEIEEKNIFTAKELNYLFPLHNQSLYEEMLDTNEWRREYMPHFPLRKGGSSAARSPIQRTFEFFLDWKAGAVMDRFCMQITESFWRRKYKSRYGSGENIRCARHVSKFHPKGYENKVLVSYKEKIRDFQKTNNILLV